MSQRWVLCPIVGTGAEKDGYRSKLRDLGIDYVAHLPSNPDGSPKFSWCLCLASAPSFAALDADATFDSFPAVAMDMPLSTLSAAIRTKIQTALTNRGVDLTGITGSSTVGELLQRAGSTLGAGWTYDRVTLA